MPQNRQNMLTRWRSWNSIKMHWAFVSNNFHLCLSVSKFERLFDFGFYACGQWNVKTRRSTIAAASPPGGARDRSTTVSEWQTAVNFPPRCPNMQMNSSSWRHSYFLSPSPLLLPRPSRRFSACLCLMSLINEKCVSSLIRVMNTCRIHTFGTI